MKKTNTLNALCAIAIALLPNYFYAQDWLLGGNPANGGNGTVSNSNYFGTASPNNEWLQFGVNGNQDIFIDNLTGIPQLLPANSAGANLQGGHWIGLGRVFVPSSTNPALAPQAHLHIHETGGLLGGLGSPYVRFTTG